MTTQHTEERPRFQSERQSEIARLLYDNGRVEVSNLAKRFSVTTETIRRDLSELASLHVVRRVHGGAIAFESLRHEPMLIVRDTHDAEEKTRIARRAVEELPSEGSVIIDSGLSSRRCRCWNRANDPCRVKAPGALFGAPDGTAHFVRIPRSEPLLDARHLSLSRAVFHRLVHAMCTRP